MIRVAVDPANPGQFFACCGLLELADRLWHGAEGWFESRQFCLRPYSEVKEATDVGLFGQLTACRLTNTMTPEEIARLDELSKMTGAARKKVPGADDEKKALEKLHREAPILLHEPFNLCLDWFHDDLAGGSRFKTWAGQQSVFTIASAMKKALDTPEWRTRPAEAWLRYAATGCGLPFNFDSDLGGQGGALDIGFSFDPLAGSDLTRIESSARPFLELLAFVGLQRFRPRQLGKDNRFVYCVWNRPLLREIAAPAACALLPTPGGAVFEFRLLYRTKYLKSFLPAIPFTGGSDE